MSDLQSGGLQFSGAEVSRLFGSLDDALLPHHEVLSQYQSVLNANMVRAEAAASPLPVPEVEPSVLAMAAVYYRADKALRTAECRETCVVDVSLEEAPVVQEAIQTALAVRRRQAPGRPDDRTNRSLMMMRRRVAHAIYS